jgi:hypothetical protein
LQLTWTLLSILTIEISPFSARLRVQLWQSNWVRRSGLKAIRTKTPSVRVRTPADVYEAQCPIVVPERGPRILEHLGLPLEVERQVAYWFEPLGGLKPFLPDRAPHLHLGVDEGGVFYGFPRPEQ